MSLTTKKPSTTSENNYLHRDQILTTNHLLQFKEELLSELKQMIVGRLVEPQKQWLKSYEVRSMLGISRGTLQNLRNNGTLNASKIGGLMYYAYEDIVRLMQNRHRH